MVPNKETDGHSSWLIFKGFCVTCPLSGIDAQQSQHTPVAPTSVGTNGRGATSIHVVRGSLNVEDGVTESQELRALERFREEIRQHVLGGTVDDLGVTLGHDIGDEEIPNLDVAGLLPARRPAVDLELDRTLVVLVNQRRTHVISLCFDEVLRPQHLREHVADTYKFSMG